MRSNQTPILPPGPWRWRLAAALIGAMVAALVSGRLIANPVVGQPAPPFSGTDADGRTWSTIISSAPGEQGYVTASQANQLTASREAKPTDVVLDPDGVIGRA